jgi:hypothetical protein
MIATAIAAGYERLDVYCEGCRHKIQIPWAPVGRPPEPAPRRPRQRPHVAANFEHSMNKRKKDVKNLTQ